MKSIGEIREEIAKTLPSQMTQILAGYADDPRSGVQRLLAKAQKDLVGYRHDDDGTCRLVLSGTGREAADA